MKRGMSRLELFVSGKLIKPYVSNDLDERVRNPIKFSRPRVPLNTSSGQANEFGGAMPVSFCRKA